MKLVNVIKLSLFVLRSKEKKPREKFCGNDSDNKLLRAFGREKVERV
jgi:hypothetical protein